MEVSGQLHALTALLPGKESPLNIQWEAGSTLEAAGTFLKAEKSFVVVSNRTPAHSARGLVATPTTIAPFLTQKGLPQYCYSWYM